MALAENIKHSPSQSARSNGRLDNYPAISSSRTQSSARDGGLIGISGFVTAAWVKQRYSIANSTLYLWITNKRLPAPMKIGPRAVRFRLDDILDFEAQLVVTKDSQAAAAIVEQSDAQ